MGNKVEFQFPIKGKDTNNPIEKQPLQTSPDLENVRPYDQLEIRMRGGQRPGCRKWGAGSRVGGGDYRIDKLVAAAVGTSEWIEDNQMTWLLVPYVYSCGSISMAATAVGAYYGVEYEFDCTTDDTYDSGWQDSNVHTITGLTSETPLTFRCRAREKSPGIKVTLWSSSEAVTPNARPQPDPMTWATEPYVSDQGEISMVATTATDPSGVEYYFTCESGAGGSDRDWADSASYTDTGLTAATEYCYTAKARDKSGLQCENTKSATKCASTYRTLQKINDNTTSAATEWSKDPTGAKLSTIAVDSGGNFIVGGSRVGNNTVWKYNSSWVLQWDYDTGEFVEAVYVDGSDNVFVTGIRGTDEDSDTASVWKLNSSGVKQWDENYSAWGRDITVDSSGNVIVAGQNGDVHLLNSSGTKQWDYTLEAAARCVDTDSSDNIYAGSSVGAPGAKNLYKLDTSGNLLDSLVMAVTVYDVQVYNDTTIYAGTGNPGGIGGLFQYDDSLAEQWQFDPNNNNVWNFDIDASENIFIITSRELAGALKTVYKVNSSGTKQWDFDSLPEAGNSNWFHDGIVLSGGDIYVVGARRGY